MSNSIPLSIIPTNEEKWNFIKMLSEDLRTPIKKQLTEVVLNTFVPFFSDDFIETNDRVLNWLLGDKTYFFQGRRGTGKSFYFIYAHNRLENKKDVISVYLDLKDIFKSVPGVEKNHLIFTFYLKLFLILRGELLNRISKISQVLKTSKAATIYKLDEKIKKLKNKLKEISYIEINIDKLEEIYVTEYEDCDQKEYKKILEEINRKINEEVNKIYEKIKKDIHSDDDELSFSIKELSRDFISLIEEIIINFNIKIYIFLDEFSDIVPSRRRYTSQIQTIFFEHLFMPLNKKGVIFKVAVYPEDNFLTSNIIRDVTAEIKNIDLLYYIEDNREGDISFKTLMKRGSIVLEKIIEKKIQHYQSKIFPDNTKKTIQIKDIFKINSDDSFFTNLFQCVFGSVRNMGYLLHKIYDENYREDSFNLISDEDISNAALKYFEECEKSLKSDLEKEMLFNMDSYDVWQLLKDFFRELDISNKNKETRGIFHVALDNISNDSRLQLRDIEGHSLINFIFTRSSKHDNGDPLKLYMYRINQGFLLNNKWHGIYDHPCRAKKYSVNNIFDKMIKINCDSGHEHKIDDLKKQSRSDNPKYWICTVYVKNKDTFCGSKFNEYINKWNQNRSYSYKELSKNFENFLRRSFRYHPIDSENVIDVLVYIYSQEKGQSSKEIATSKELERYELTAYQVAGYLRRNYVKDLIDKEGKHYYFNKELFEQFLN